MSSDQAREIARLAKVYGKNLAALVLTGGLAVRLFQGGKPAALATAAIDLARVWDKLDQVRRARVAKGDGRIRVDPARRVDEEERLAAADHAVNR